MNFICHYHHKDGENPDTKSFLELSNLYNINVSEFDFILGIEYLNMLNTTILGVLSIDNSNIDIKFITPFTTDKNIINAQIMGSKLFDSFKKLLYVSTLNFKILYLDELIKLSYNKTFNCDMMNSFNFITPDILTGRRERKLTFILNYTKYIKDDPTNGNFIFECCSTSSFELSNKEKLKDFLKAFINSSLKIITCVKDNTLEKYIYIQKFFRDILEPAYTRKELKISSIITFMKLIDKIDNPDLEYVFKNRSTNPKAEQLMDLFKTVQKLPIKTRADIKINCDNIPIVLTNRLSKLKYELYGSTFSIPLNSGWETNPKSIQFFNTIINLDKFNSVKNNCEKLILLNC